jgi:hypothetical protein
MMCRSDHIDWMINVALGISLILGGCAAIVGLVAVIDLAHRLLT